MVDEKEDRRSLDVALVVAGAAALWPVWFWHCRRLVSSPDEAAGLAASALAFAFAWRGAGVRSLAAGALPAVLFGLYAALFPYAPPLARAALGVTALAALISPWRFRRAMEPGFWLLLLLSLPVMPSLQFYCGYPFRRLAALAAALLLRLQGVPALADGAALDWAGSQLSIDAPCSGLKMLWAGLVLGAAISCQSRWGWLATGATALLALAICLTANVWRACALFYVETSPALPPWLHEAVGLVCFAAAGMVLVLGAKGVQRWAAAR